MSKRFSKIYVEITNKCNLHCSFCSIDNLPKKEMTIDEFRMVIDKIKDYTDNVCLHVKGEPLLHSSLDEILTICNDNKINIRLTTNGTLLKNKVDILLKHEIKQINISLHSENDYPNYFIDVFNAGDKLSQKTTVIYRLWALPSMTLNTLSTNIVNKIINHYSLSTNIVDKIMSEKNIKIQKNIYIDKDYEYEWPKITDKKSNNGTCLGTKTHIAILSNGNVTPCCLDSGGKITFGNIFKDSLSDIVNSDNFKKINEGFKKNQVISPLCQSCTYRNRFKDKKNDF